MYILLLRLHHWFATKTEQRQLAKILNRIITAGVVSQVDHHNYEMLRRWAVGMQSIRKNRIMRSGKHTRK